MSSNKNSNLRKNDADGMKSGQKGPEVRKKSSAMSGIENPEAASEAQKVKKLKHEDRLPTLISKSVPSSAISKYSNKSRIPTRTTSIPTTATPTMVKSRSKYANSIPVPVQVIKKPQQPQIHIFPGGSRHNLIVRSNHKNEVEEKVEEKVEPKVRSKIGLKVEPKTGSKSKIGPNVEPKAIEKQVEKTESILEILSKEIEAASEEQGEDEVENVIKPVMPQMQEMNESQNFEVIPTPTHSEDKFEVIDQIDEVGPPQNAISKCSLLIANELNEAISEKIEVDQVLKTEDKDAQEIAESSGEVDPNFDEEIIKEIENWKLFNQISVSKVDQSESGKSSDPVDSGFEKSAQDLKTRISFITKIVHNIENSSVPADNEELAKLKCEFIEKGKFIQEITLKSFEDVVQGDELINDMMNKAHEIEIKNSELKNFELSKEGLHSRIIETAQIFKNIENKSPSKHQFNFSQEMEKWKSDTNYRGEGMQNFEGEVLESETYKDIKMVDKIINELFNLAKKIEDQVEIQDIMSKNEFEERIENGDIPSTVAEIGQVIGQIEQNALEKNGSDSGQENGEEVYQSSSDLGSTSSQENNKETEVINLWKNDLNSTSSLNSTSTSIQENNEEMKDVNQSNADSRSTSSLNSTSASNQENKEETKDISQSNADSSSTSNQENNEETKDVSQYNADSSSNSSLNSTSNKENKEEIKDVNQSNADTLSNNRDSDPEVLEFKSNLVQEPSESSINEIMENRNDIGSKLLAEHSESLENESTAELLDENDNTAEKVPENEQLFQVKHSDQKITINLNLDNSNSMIGTADASNPFSLLIRQVDEKSNKGAGTEYKLSRQSTGTTIATNTSSQVSKGQDKGTNTNYQLKIVVNSMGSDTTSLDIIHSQLSVDPDQYDPVVISQVQIPMKKTKNAPKKKQSESDVDNFDENNNNEMKNRLQNGSEQNLDKRMAAKKTSNKFTRVDGRLASSVESREIIQRLIRDTRAPTNFVAYLTREFLSLSLFEKLCLFTIIISLFIVMSTTMAVMVPHGLAHFLAFFISVVVIMGFGSKWEMEAEIEQFENEQIMLRNELMDYID